MVIAKDVRGGATVPSNLVENLFDGVADSAETHTHLSVDPLVAQLTLTPLIGVSNVTVQYGKTAALQDIALTLYAGKRVAIVGPNGAGKSTLLKLIAGEIRPNTGQIKLHGFGSDAHLSIAYVPQHKQIDWNFPVTVYDVVMMGRVGRIGLFRRASRHDRKLVEQSLARVGMSEFANKRIGALSGGQQQRVFIARALAQEAKLLLLDEPLTGLDAPSRDIFLSLLDDVAAQGVTIVMATHDLNLAQTSFDNVLLLNRHLIASGAAERVLSAENLRQAYSNHLYAHMH